MHVFLNSLGDEVLFLNNSFSSCSYQAFEWTFHKPRRYTWSTNPPPCDPCTFKKKIKPLDFLCSCNNILFLFLHYPLYSVVVWLQSHMDDLPGEHTKQMFSLQVGTRDNKEPTLIPRHFLGSRTLLMSGFIQWPEQIVTDSDIRFLFLWVCVGSSFSELRQQHKISMFKIQFWLFLVLKDRFRLLLGKTSTTWFGFLIPPELNHSHLSHFFQMFLPLGLYNFQFFHPLT